jgi:hypothetical protein
VRRDSKGNPSEIRLDRNINTRLAREHESVEGLGCREALLPVELLLGSGERRSPQEMIDTRVETQTALITTCSAPQSTQP